MDITPKPDGTGAAILLNGLRVDYERARSVERGIRNACLYGQSEDPISSPLEVIDLFIWLRLAMHADTLSSPQDKANRELLNKTFKSPVFAIGETNLGSEIAERSTWTVPPAVALGVFASMVVVETDAHGEHTLYLQSPL